jgi:hypothetical protein
MLLDIEQNIANLERSLNQGEKFRHIKIKWLFFRDEWLESRLGCKNILKFLHSLSEAEHKKQNIFQRALGGDKSHHSNSAKLKVRTVCLFTHFYTTRVWCSEKVP